MPIFINFFAFPDVMMLVIYGICLFLLLIGTFTDIRVREVPDWLSYAGVFAGLGLRLIWSFYSFDWGYILEGLAGFGVFFALACALFYLGQWGGGDAKLLMALGALLGIGWDFNHVMIAFVFNLMIIGGLYGLCWSSVLAVMNWKKFVSQFRKSLDSHKKLRALGIGFAFALFVYAFFVESVFSRFVLIFAALFIPLLNYLVLFVKAVEKCCMYRRVKPSELTEGDWIAKDVIVRGKRVCGPKDLGVEKSQIRRLVKAGVRSVLVRVGIPFVPAFLFAFLVTLWIGSPLAYFL